MGSISIIVPPAEFYYNPKVLQPLMELHYATIIENNLININVDIVDLRGLREKEYISKIKEKDFLFYWIDRTGDYKYLQSFVRQYRKIFPNSIHIAGGVYTDVFGEDCLDTFNIIIKGPGERSIIKILSDNTDTQKVFTDSYSEVHYGDYSFAKRHFLSKDMIVNKMRFLQHKKPILSTDVMFSRGCYFKCSFCCTNIPNKQQFKPAEVIEEEINYLKNQYGVGAINLKDQVALPANNKIAIPLLEAIQSTNILWRGQTTVLGSTDDKLLLAKKSGCLELAVGIESVSYRVREIIRKPLREKQIQLFFENCKKHDIKTKLNLVIGLPGEPKTIVKDTIKFIEQYEPDFVNIHGLNPDPGSHMYDNPELYGIEVMKDTNLHSSYLLYRFTENETTGIAFNYTKNNKYDTTFSREEIIGNVKELQNYLNKRSKIY